MTRSLPLNPSGGGFARNRAIVATAEVVAALGVLYAAAAVLIHYLF
jgi:hypothetical protein